MSMASISTADGAMARPRLRPIIANAAVVAAAIIGVMGAFAGTAQAQVPTIDIRETCRAAAGAMVNLMGGTSSQNDVDICLESENKAQQQMIKDWSTFEPSDRAGCIQPNVYLPSYIEWLTCFDMNKVVRQARQQGQAMKSLTSADGSVTLPPVCSLGIMKSSCLRTRGRE
jgi:hypothetical protein